MIPQPIMSLVVQMVHIHTHYPTHSRKEETEGIYVVLCKQFFVCLLALIRNVRHTIYFWLRIFLIHLNTLPRHNRTSDILIGHREKVNMINHRAYRSQIIESRRECVSNQFAATNNNKAIVDERSNKVSAADSFT